MAGIITFKCLSLGVLDVFIIYIYIYICMGKHDAGEVRLTRAKP